MWARDGRRRLAAILTVVVLLWQGLVVQPHVHPGPIAAGIGSPKAVAIGRGADRSGSPDDPQACPLCRELVLAGAYLTPAVPFLVAVDHIAVAASETPFPSIRQHRPSHSWRSRGPPTPPRPRP